MLVTERTRTLRTRSTLPAGGPLQNRPLRQFEQGAHLHVLDWTHNTVRYRFQDAGAKQVKAAARTVVEASPDAQGPLELPSLEAAMVGELRKLYALGYATVRSELDHQADPRPLPIGLSAAPAPPNLRKAKARKGKARNCATCRMYDASAGVCWGFGNYPVKPNQICDAYARDSEPKQLAADPGQNDPGQIRARGRLIAQAVAHSIWQAIHRARLQGITDPKRLKQIGRDAGAAELKNGAGHHAGGAINAGRHAAAMNGNGRNGSSSSNGNGNGASPNGNGNGNRGRIVGARYTSVLDKNTCGPCAAADDGVLRALDDPGLVHPPNPACLGGDRCRCILVYQLDSEVVPVA